MGRMVNKEQTQNKPNEGFQLHRPELLIAAVHGYSHEIKRLLLLHREENAARQRVEVVLDVEETITDIEDSVADITGAGDSVLHVVASSGDIDKFLECATVIVGKANHLLRACNLKGETPLHCAARLGNARIVSHLLARARAGDGTTADERVKVILRMQNLKGETVLHEAVRLEDKEMISELLSADSQLARVPLNDGASPLYLALSLGRRDIAQQLFKKDKELSYSGPDGQNALHADVLWKRGEGEYCTQMYRTQIIGLGSVLVTTVTFAAAFAVPGGYRADGTPTLAGQYAFDSFVAANTLAFTFSAISIILLMFAGLGAEFAKRIFSLRNSINYLAWSAKSLGATFAFGLYAVLAPVERRRAILSCIATVTPLGLLEVFWTFRAVKMAYRANVALVKRFGVSQAWWNLALPVLLTLMSELTPYILIACLGIPLDSGRK